MNGNVGYFTVSAENVDRAKAFFGGLFGWEFEGPGSGGGWHIAGSNPPGGLHGGGSGPRLYFKVDDIQAAVEKIRKLGGKADDPKDAPEGPYSDCTDDQGTEFSLWQPATGD